MSRLVVWFVTFVSDLTVRGVEAKAINTKLKIVCTENARKVNKLIFVLSVVNFHVINLGLSANEKVQMPVYT